MAIETYKEALEHVSHKLEAAQYPGQVVIECLTCHAVLVEFDENEATVESINKWLDRLGGGNIEQFYDDGGNAQGYVIHLPPKVAAALQTRFNTRFGSLEHAGEWLQARVKDVFPDFNFEQE